ncbi:uncharacterized protein LOC110017944 [Phalaenopsis equestris]|uniref:uncharacterized protein LOC110017944 n=1 Tax=Phalaenopsis equestris TaxID=78828 RepID=UPI0009E2C20F|nr:uncharacterized protein LOC110017944 [Phalaenopsis equestris]
MEAPPSTPQQAQEVPRSKPANAAAAAVVVTAEQDGKKRKLDHDGFRGSKYFKICSIAKELRPFFVEVSRTPNFRNSKAAHEIQIRMKTLAELTKELRSETSSLSKRYDISLKEPFSSVVKEEKIEKEQEGEKQVSLPEPSVDPAENGIKGLSEESLLDNVKSISEK